MTKSFSLSDRKLSARSSGLAAILVAISISVSACNTPTKAVDSMVEQPQMTSEEQAAAEAAKEEDNIRRQSAQVTQKGTTIRAIVNGAAITSTDVRHRAAFLRLRRVSGNLNSKALEEMVDQTIKLQEAAKRNTLASNAQVDEAFANFAKSNKMSTSQMGQVLSKSGVAPSHFKDFIRGQISWSRTMSSKIRAETNQKSASDALFEIRKSGGEKPKTNEYLLEQTIFVIPADKSKSMLTQRRAEANAFRKTFTKCGETAAKAVGLRDVTVRSLPRSLEPQLPPEWKDEISKLSEGGVTDIKNTEKGVEFIAICSKREVSDDNAAKIISQQKDFDSFNESGNAQGDAYLKELKSQSSIIYR